MTQAEKNYFLIKKRKEVFKKKLRLNKARRNET